MNGSEFQEIGRVLADLEKRIVKLEAEMRETISEEEEKRALCDLYGGDE